MRARKKKNTVPRLERCENYLSDKVEINENTRFRLEVGCGKGKFITEVATKPENKDIVFYAVEKVPDVMVMAAEKAAAAEIGNLQFILGDAETLPEICPPHRAEIIYLNFSDPWPRKKQAKRRLTYRSFLEIYRGLLSDDGYIFMKTDNQKLFDYSLEEIETHGYELFDVTRDLHNSGIYNPATTEYEDRFTALGQPIYSLKARPIPGYVPQPEPEKKDDDDSSDEE